MRAALRSRHGVHLVENQRLDVLHVLARARGQQEKQRFRCRDEDIRWVTQHRRPFLLRGVARPHPDA